MFSSSKSPNIYILLILLFLGLLVFGNSTSGSFLWDDYHLIVNNSLIRNFENLPKIMTSPMAAGSFNTMHYYRPLQAISYMFDYHFWALQPMGYHVSNVLLHCIIAMLVYVFINMLSHSKFTSFVSAVIFLVHPIQSETVCALMARGELLAALFTLTTLILYLKYLDSNRPYFIFFVILSSLLAFLSKENSIVLLLLIPAYHFSINIKFKFQAFLPILVGFLIYLLIRVTYVPGLTNIWNQLQGGFNRIPGFFYAILQYLRMLCLPFHLHYDYGQKIFSLAEPVVICGLLATVFLLALAAQLRNKTPNISFFILWFFIALLPYSNIYLIYNYIADHHLYIASIGIFFVMASLFEYLLSIKPIAMWARCCGIAILSMFIFLSINQNLYWQNPIFFYQRTLEYNPNSWQALNNLAIEFGRRGDYQNEILNYKKALAINPASNRLLRNLGSAYRDAGQLEKAKGTLLKATETGVDYKAWNRLGVVYRDLKEWSLAMHAFEQAIRINPDYYFAHLNAGLLYFELGQYEESQDQFKKVLNYDPQNVKARRFFNRTVDLIQASAPKY